MNILIAGYGFVGQAHEKLLQEQHNVMIYDPAQGYNDFPDDVVEAMIICVSTPPAKDGSCDMSNVYVVIVKCPDVPIIIKSTISIDGWDTIQEQYKDRQISFSPEFLRAKTAYDDLKNTDKIYIGGNNIEFWSLFKKDIVTCEPKALVLAKYFRNAFLATKVNYFNQVFDLCTALNIEYECVRKAITDDPRIGDSHSYITEERGFGGHCFPKDVQALLKSAEKEKVSLGIIEKALEYNNIIKSL